MTVEKIVAIVCGSVFTGASSFAIAYGTVKHFEKDKEERDRKYERLTHDDKVKEQKYQDEKERADRELKDKEKYWESMSSEDKATVEVEKEKTEQKRLEARTKEAEAKTAEAESKSAVTRFKNDILNQVRNEAMDYVKSDSKNIFNDWSRNTEDKIDRKIEKINGRIDNIKDDYADKADLKSLRRRVNDLEESNKSGSQSAAIPITGGAGSSPTITVAPVIGK